MAPVRECTFGFICQLGNLPSDSSLVSLVPHTPFEVNGYVANILNLGPFVPLRYPSQRSGLM